MKRPALAACSVEPAVTGTAEHQVYVDTYDHYPPGSTYPACRQ